MKRPAPRPHAVPVAVTTLATFALGLATAVFVSGAASAALPTTSAATTTSTAPTTTSTTSEDSPAAGYLVLNGTANAASVHVVGGSSAFPNFKTGAIDNYYSMAHSHVDNSPFAQGTATPLDSGPIGQTAAAGHFQQPQYADARWPGDGKATYGKQGEPHAAASASEYRATAEASVASRASGGPSGPSALPVPNGLGDRLEQALAAWKADWAARLAPKQPAGTPPTPKIPPVTTPPVTVGSAKTKPPVPVPSPPMPSPVAPPAVSPPPAPPPPAVPSPTLPSLPGGSKSSPAPSRSLAAASAPRDGVFLLESSTLVAFEPKAGTAKTATPASSTAKKGKKKSGTAKTGTPKTGTLVTRGESSLARVSLGGGQIVIEDIHVSASIANDGAAPTHKVTISVGAASIGGVPITIDQDGVHVAAQRQGLPYEQASDALNGALKQAGIQLFLVAPEITTDACEQTGTGGDDGAGTTTSSSDQSGPSTAASSCDQSGAPATCEQTGSGTTTTTTATTTTTTDTTPTPIPTTPSNDEPDPTATTSSCGESYAPPTTSSCEPAGTATGSTTTTSSRQGTTTTPSTSDQTGMGTGTTSSGGMTVRATGLHVVFTQPARPGVPAHNVEHVLGEVFLDSLAVPAVPLADLDLSSSSLSSLSPSSCLGGGNSPGTSSGAASLGGSGSSSAGGSISSGSLSPAESAFGSTSQATSGSTGSSLPAAFAAALTKPLWLLLTYLLWQAIVIGTGVSLWNWRRGEAS